MIHLLATLTWDPQIRGAAIVLTGIVMLPGSVYLLLATNMGAKIGFVLALTGLAGWMTIMGAVWLVFGIGLKGPEPQWRAKEIITGPIAQSLTPVGSKFPKGWTELHPGDAELADAQATADKLLAPSAAPAAGPEQEAKPDPVAARFKSPFKSTADYVVLDGFRYGGEKYFFTLRHRPHYVIVRVKPVLFNSEVAPAGLKPQPDLAADTLSVLMVRDLGHLRLPPFLVMLTAAVVFGVCCWNLHERDKEIWRARAVATA
ncbi:MAG TPA: hypothetical protein VFJ85_12670 [Acidimicrobiales bacterium]|nr:hypothetical protein [Acidimicrobiales bacterium]